MAYKNLLAGSITNSDPSQNNVTNNQDHPEGGGNNNGSQGFGAKGGSFYDYNFDE